MTLYEVLDNIIVGNEPTISTDVFSNEECNKISSNSDKIMFSLIKKICSMYCTVSDKTIKFGPKVVVEDLHDTDYDSLKQLDFSKLPLNIRALISSLLWIQKKDYEFSEIACDSYFELYKLWIVNESWPVCIDAIKKVIYISLSTRNKNLNSYFKHILNDIISLNGEDESFLSIKLIQLLIESKYDDDSKTIPIIDKIIKSSTDNINKLELAYEIKIKHPKIKNNANIVKATNIKLAEFYVNYADNLMTESSKNAMSAEHFILMAVQIYRNNHEPEKAEETHKKLINIQNQISNNLSSLQYSFTLNGFDKIFEINFKGLSFQESLIRLSYMIPFEKKDSIKKHILNKAKKYPLQYLCNTNIINKSGQTLFKMPPLISADINDSDLNTRIHYELFCKQSFTGNIFIRSMWLNIIKQINFTQNDLDFLICNNGIIPSGMGDIFKKAIYLGLKGQYFESITILAPQVENLFRNLAHDCGAITVTIEADGTSKQKVLSSIFDLPELLESYDNDILFNFRSLLNEQSGANIRNNIAHGLLTEEDCEQGIYIYFIFAVIKLLTLTSPQCDNIVNKNPDLLSYSLPENLDNIISDFKIN